MSHEDACCGDGNRGVDPSHLGRLSTLHFRAYPFPLHSSNAIIQINPISLPRLGTNSVSHLVKLVPSSPSRVCIINYFHFPSVTILHYLPLLIYEAPILIRDSIHEKEVSVGRS